MPAPPIENPTPYTCSHCGAGLQERAEFCPHCGARLEIKTSKSLGFVVVSVMLALGTLVFGGVGACSGVVTYASIVSPSFELGQGLLVISIPLGFVGLGGIFFCGRALVRRSRE